MRGLHPCRGIQHCDTRDGLTTLSWSPMAIELCRSGEAGSRAVRGSDRPRHRPSPATNRLSAATVHIVRPWSLSPPSVLTDQMWPMMRIQGVALGTGRDLARVKPLF